MEFYRYSTVFVSPYIPKDCSSIRFGLSDFSAHTSIQERRIQNDPWHGTYGDCVCLTVLCVVFEDKLMIFCNANARLDVVPACYGMQSHWSLRFICPWKSLQRDSNQRMNTRLPVTLCAVCVWQILISAVCSWWFMKQVLSDFMFCPFIWPGSWILWLTLPTNGISKMRCWTMDFWQHMRRFIDKYLVSCVTMHTLECEELIRTSPYYHHAWIVRASVHYSEID